jgi:hypothetical protein
MNILGNDITTWSPNFESYGNTYIVWGTEGIFGSYIVVSANESQRIEEINIENGAGFEAVVILLNKGIDVEINVVDDTSIAPPVIANNPFVLVTPYGPPVSMALVASKADQARKREGMRTFTFKSFTAIPVL